MSSFSRHLLETDRLAVVTDISASLNTRMRELERLRAQVNKAQLSARNHGRSPLRKSANLEQQKPPQLAAAIKKTAGMSAASFPSSQVRGQPNRLKFEIWLQFNFRSLGANFFLKGVSGGDRLF